MSRFAIRLFTNSLLAKFETLRIKEMVTLEQINQPNALVIIAVFMVSMLTGCVSHSGEVQTFSREVQTFAQIAKNIEANPEKAINTYVGRVVNIRAKAGIVAGLRSQLSKDFSAHLRGSGRVGSRFVSFWVQGKPWVRNEPFQPDKFFRSDGGSDDPKFYLFKVRIKTIDPNMALHYWTVWMEILEWSER